MQCPLAFTRLRQASARQGTEPPDDRVSRTEDVGLTHDIVQQRGLPIATELGQHNNDRALSFYVRTPSGWSWETGSGVVTPSGRAEYATRDVSGIGARGPHHLCLTDRRVGAHLEPLMPGSDRPAESVPIAEITRRIAAVGASP